MTASHRRALTWIAAIAGLLLVGVTSGYLLLVHLSLEAAQAGRASFQWLGVEIEHRLVARIIARLAENTDGPFAALIRSTIYSKFLLGWAFSTLVAVSLVFRHRTRDIVLGYFTAATHPLNLAVFRIAIFGFAAVMLSYDYILLFASLPTSFIIPPVGMEGLLDLLPVRPQLASWAYGLFLASTLMAAAGFMTRAAAIVAVLTGTYVLGIPNFYGKVDHYNHVLWFMAILAASPAGDTLSVDAILRSWRLRRPPASLEPSLRYALPLRIVWLLIGICYFFPGLWKVARGGLAWPLSDTFRDILYRQWAVIPGFEAPFALDRFPLLYRSAASAAVLFELAFIFLIFFPVLRRLAVLAGLGFHNVTGLMMNIWFLPMQVSYAAFVDWRLVFRTVGAWIFRNEATLAYDDRHPVAGKLVAATLQVDLFQRVRFVAERPENDATASIRYASARRLEHGWRAWLCSIPRVPLAILLLPGFLLAGVPGRLARDASEARGPRAGMSSPSARSKPHVPWAAIVVGTGLLLINGWFGARRIEGGWPFASYPTFATIRNAHIERLTVTEVGVGGRSTTVDLSDLIDTFQYQKFGPLVMSIAETEDRNVRRDKLAVLHALIIDSVDGVDPNDVILMRFATVSADPADRDADPIDVVFVATLGDAGDP